MLLGVAVLVKDHNLFVQPAGPPDRVSRLPSPLPSLGHRRLQQRADHRSPGFIAPPSSPHAGRSSHVPAGGNAPARKRALEQQQVQQ
jgi:hypothetical protein